MLVDNDDSTRVRQQGNWQLLTKGSQYGKTAMLSAGGQASVTFQATSIRPGRYQIYIYNPTRRGGGGNPDQVAYQADKAAAATVRVFDGKSDKALTINQQKQNNDWISLGTYQFSGGKTPTVSFVATGSTEPVVADAVLFLPIN